MRSKGLYARVLGGVLGTLLCAACSSNGSSNLDGGPRSDGVQKKDGTITGKTLTFIKTTIENSFGGGKNTVIATNGSLIGIAYYHQLPADKWPDVPCPPSGALKKEQVNDLYFTKSTDGGLTWSAPVKVDTTIGKETFGLSMVIDKAGKISIGHLGGATGLRVCQSSDAVISSSTNGTTWTKTTYAQNGPTGDTVGMWMAIALDGAGAVQAVYRDTLFGLYQSDDEQKALPRYGTGGEPVQQDQAGSGVGGGRFCSLEFDTKGQPVVLHYNAVETGANGGLLLGTKSGSGWSNKQLAGGATSERPELATDGKGKFGVVYFHPSSEGLRYIESTGDLQTWTPHELVDINPTHHGEFASLTFDSAGNPAASYYRCGGPGCAKGDKDDAAMFAWKLNGSWKAYEVDNGGVNQCGVYTSVVMVNDLPIVAYQCVTVDSLTKQFVSSVKVARGIWK